MLLPTITYHLTKLIYASVAKHHSALNKSMVLVTEQEKSSVKSGFSDIQHLHAERLRFHCVGEKKQILSKGSNNSLVCLLP